MPRRSKQQPTKSIKSTEQTELKFPAPEDEKLEVSAMEVWLWDAACTIRGTTDAPKFKDFILPLVFYKRLSDVFDDEPEKIISLSSYDFILAALFYAASN